MDLLSLVSFAAALDRRTITVEADRRTDTDTWAGRPVVGARLLSAEVADHSTASSFLHKDIIVFRHVGQSVMAHVVPEISKTETGGLPSQAIMLLQPQHAK